MKQKIREIDIDDDGNGIMTQKTLSVLCEKENLYEYPELNKKLYLHFKRFQKIQNLDLYINLNTLYLENNLLSKIEGLDKLVTLQHLFLQHNLIKKIEGLDNNLMLSTLNISANGLNVIENISQLTKLHTLDLSNNYIKTYEDIQHLMETSIAHVKLTSNLLEYNVNTLQIFASIKNLKCLYLSDNPGIREFLNYRKLLIGNIPSLNYLDDRNVTIQERRLSIAFVQEGDVGVKNERQKIEEERKLSKQQDTEEYQKDQLSRRENKIPYFEKQIRQGIMEVRNFEQKLKKATISNNESEIEFFSDRYYEKRKHVEEMQETLINMKKIIRKLKNLPEIDEEMPDLWQKSELPDIEMTEEEVNSIMNTLIEKNQLNESKILEEFQDIVYEMSQKIQRKIKPICKQMFKLKMDEAIKKSDQGQKQTPYCYGPEKNVDLDDLD